MTDIPPRLDGSPPSRRPAEFHPPIGPTPGGPAPYGPGGSWTTAYPPPMSPPPPPPPPPAKKGTTVVRVLIGIAAFVFGPPAVLLFIGLVAAIVDPSDPIPSPSPRAPSIAPPSIAASAVPSPPPEPETRGPLDLAVGDCFNSVPLPVDGSSVRISSVEALPCSQPHTRQVVAHFTYQGSAWDADLEARSTRDCDDAFMAELTKKAYNDDRYQMSWIRSVPRPIGVQTLRAVCVVSTTDHTSESALRT